MNDTDNADVADDGEPLGSSVTEARAQNLRETRPHLFTGEPKQEPEADDATPPPAEPSDADGTDAARAPREVSIPKARFDEVIAERNAFRDRLAAAERAEQERARQAAAAAAKPPRDFDAELAALDQELDKGTIDEDQYRQRARALDKEAGNEHLMAVKEQAKQEALAEFEQRLAQKDDRTQAEQFDDAKERFLADPANAAYQDPIRVAAMNEAMRVISAERNGKITYDDLLKTARDRVEVAFGGKPAQTAESAQQRVARERREAAAKANAAASALPDRPVGGVGARASEAAKDVEHMSRAEWRKLPAAERDRLLGKEPAAT